MRTVLSGKKKGKVELHVASKVFAVLTVAAGLAIVGVTLVGGSLEAVQALGACATPDAVIRYELVYDPQNLIGIFGEMGDPCRPARVAAMDALNHGDLFFYVPAYTAFLVCAAFFLGRLGRGRLSWVGAGLAAAAGVSDVFETLGLLSFSPEHAPEADALAQVYWFATGKFVLLVVNALVMAWMVLAQRSVLRWIVAGLLCLPVFGVAAMYADQAYIQLQTLSFTLGWLGVLMLAVNALVRGDRVRA